MYCKHCGKQIEDDVKFCPYCGAMLDLSTPSPIQSQQSTETFAINNMQQPPSTVSDIWIWMLAIAPIVLVTIIEIICTLLGISDSFITWGSTGLYAGLIFLDAQELKNKEKKMSIWLYIVGILLVPVYLFVREKKTNHNYIPGIVWCVLFCVYVGIIFFIA